MIMESCVLEVVATQKLMGSGVVEAAVKQKKKPMGSSDRLMENMLLKLLSSGQASGNLCS